MVKKKKQEKPTKKEFVEDVQQHIDAIIFNTEENEELAWVATMFLNAARTILTTQYEPAKAKELIDNKIDELFKL